MAMTPQEKNKMDMLEKRVNAMYRGEDVAFIRTMIRRIFGLTTVTDLPPIKLSDLSDVSGTDSASTGQVLKKTSGDWQPGTDNTGP